MAITHKKDIGSSDHGVDDQNTNSIFLFAFFAAMVAIAIVALILTTVFTHKTYESPDMASGVTGTSTGGNRLEFSGTANGPIAHLRLHDWAVLDDLTARGEIGFADAYVDGRWDTQDLPALLTFGLVNSQSLERFFYGRPWYTLWLRLRYLLRANSLLGSKRNIMAHYDLGNDFYALWLDEGMTYSGALFEGDEKT